MITTSPPAEPPPAVAHLALVDEATAALAHRILRDFDLPDELHSLAAQLLVSVDVLHLVNGWPR